MLVTMTDRELYRLGIIQRVFDRALLQRDAADILELSVRQVQRLVRLYRTDGATAFASSRRGRPANNRINEEIRCKTLDLKPGNHQLNTTIRDQTLQFIRTRGRGMNPSAIWRILTTEYGVRISKETVRKMMIAERTWQPRSSSDT